MSERKIEDNGVSYTVFFVSAINLVNGISLNGLGDSSMDLGGGHSMMNTSNLIGLSNSVVGASGTPPPGSVNQPNIHPGCIPSTGRMNSGNGGAAGGVFLNNMPQNLTFSANGANGGQQNFMVQQQQQAQYGASNMTNGGAMSNSNSLKFNNNNGSLHQQTYMHHN